MSIKEKKDVRDVQSELIDNSCDIDPKKICDNCCKCLEMDKNYKIIKITKIITDNE